MYIKQIGLKRVRCFTDVSIDLSSPDGVKNWLVIVGDNGVGKTTVLRSIAMGLCDETGSASLLQDTYGDWIRWDEDDAEIFIELWDGVRKECSIKTTIYTSASGLETVKQERKPEQDFPWKELFVCGYGANRSIQGTAGHEKYSTADAIYTLFNYDYPLQHPELMLRRRGKTKDEENEILGWLSEVLMLDEGSATLDDPGLALKGSWGRDVLLGSLGDGHVAMTTLLLDMLGWALLAGLKEDKNKLSGIVIIDELEQHLHPSWQKYIIKLLHKVFPNLQFIATSHSPLCAIGTGNLPDDVCSLAHLNQQDTYVDIRDKIPPPRGQRADQVLTSYLFGLSTSSDDPTRDAIHKYAELQSRPRSNAEEVEFQELKNYLNKTIGTAESQLEQKVANAVKKVLIQERDASIAKSSEGERLTDLEIARQLRELLGEHKE